MVRGSSVKGKYKSLFIRFFPLSKSGVEWFLHFLNAMSLEKLDHRPFSNWQDANSHSLKNAII